MGDALTLLERGDGSEKVPRVGEVVRPDGPAVRQREMTLEDLRDPPAGHLLLIRRLLEGHRHFETLREHEALARAHLQRAELCAHAQHALLGYLHVAGGGRVSR